MPTMFAHFSDVPNDQWRWPNFPPNEPNLACRHCGELYLDEHAMDMLQAARSILKKPIKLNSGHRCWLHNARVKGAPKSAHKRIAFDISTHKHDRKELLDACLTAGFTTFGFYVSFLHTDPRPGRRWYASEQARLLWTG